MADEIAIKVEHVSKNFVLPHEKINSVKSLFTSAAKKRGKGGQKGSETQHALRDISFEIKKGEFFGIVGRNGSGKSTLLKILAGIYQPTSGTMHTQGKLVPFIELGVGFNPELTGRENVYLNGAMLGFSRKEVEAMYDDIVEFAELKRFMDQKLKNYSSGMQVRLAFSMATRAEADILLIDEVLAVGDADFQRKCFQYFKALKKNNKTVVFVSHDMEAVKEYCDRATLIDKSELVAIGPAHKIAARYTQLFMEKTGSNNDDKNTSPDRWGNNNVVINKADVSLVKDEVEIKLEATVHKTTDRILYGLHILASDGKELVAVNNRMIDLPDLQDTVAGTKVDITWNMLNILSDGQYSATLTLVDSSGNVLDWYSDAVKFTVKRTKRSTTPILPPIRAACNVKL
jgi:ABC-2 type transport system ATP-binding protein